MSQKFKVVLDSNNQTFSNDGTPIDLKSVKKVEISELNNEDNVEVMINLVGKDVSGRLPHGKKVKMYIDIQYPWKALFFIGINIPPNKKTTFDLEILN